MVTIDSHCHLGRLEHWNEELLPGWFETFGIGTEVANIDPLEVLGDMDAAGVSHAVVLAFNCERALDVHIPNDYVAEQCEAHPDRFIGFASVDPIARTAADEVRDAVENMGLRGLKLAPTYQDFHPDDPRAQKVFATCSDLRIPILIHQGWTGNVESRLNLQHVWLLDEVFTSFPELRVIIAHVGMPEQRHTLHLMAKHANVYADFAARDLPSFGGGPRTMFSDIADAIELDVSHKLLWGTDNPWCVAGPSLEGIRSVNEWAPKTGRPEIPKEIIDDICGANLVRLFEDLGRPIPGLQSD